MRSNIFIKKYMKIIYKYLLKKEKEKVITI